MLLCSNCGEIEMVGVYAMSQTGLFVLDAETGKYAETNWDESALAGEETYHCSACGTPLDDDIVVEFLKLIG